MINEYHELAAKYRPKYIKHLLVAEAPPPSGVYFYKPMKLALGASLENDRSLPSTIFGHYFGDRPTNIDQYFEFLDRLKEMGVFLVDILDNPVKISDRAYKGWVNPTELQKVIDAIPKLKDHLNSRGILFNETRTTFLLARNKYTKQIRQSYPKTHKMAWIDFRLRRNKCICCSQ